MSQLSILSFDLPVLSNLQKKDLEMSPSNKTRDETAPLAPVPFLHKTLLWPEGVAPTTCPHCDKKFIAGQCVAVLDARYYQKNVLEGVISEDTLYGHALCIQEMSCGGMGWIPLRTLA